MDMVGLAKLLLDEQCGRQNEKRHDVDGVMKQEMRW
jgi:hypothetical protein